MSRSLTQHGSGRGLATSLQVAAIFAAGLMSSIGVATADYTVCTEGRTLYPEVPGNTCPGGPHPTSVNLKDFNCASDPIGPSPMTDTACWQAALDCAYERATGRFGTVVATQGIQYLIDDTLCVHTARSGTIEGNAAQLFWRGPNSIDSPMWFLADTHHLDIKNLTVLAQADFPLFTAFEFTNPANTSGIAPGQNIVDHVRIEGITADALMYGVRFSFRPGYSIDANNDLNIIKDSQFFAYTLSAISIEHSQSHYNRLINVDAVSAAAGGGHQAPSCSSFVSNHSVRLPGTGCAPIYDGGGGFTVVDFSGGGNTNADYDLTATIAPNILIFHNNSEGSNRMIRAEGESGAGHPVQIIGGRFAANSLNPDGEWIKFDRRGPLTIEGIQLDGGFLPNGVVPKIKFDPSVNPTYTGETLTVRGVQFLFNNSADSNPIDLGAATGVTVNASGNLCAGADGGAKRCRGYAAGVVGSTGTPFADLDSRPNGHFAYCSDCQANTSTGVCASGGSGAFARRVGGVWKCDGAEVMLAGTQTLSNKTLDSSNTFPNTLVTTTGTQTLSNKTLTDSTNMFPATTTIGFTKPAGTTTQYCSPNGATCDPTTESKVSLAVPPMRAKTLSCKSSAAPGVSTRNWSISLRVGGATIGAPCTISTTSTSCSIAINSDPRWADGAEMALKFTASSPSPTSASIICSLGLAP